MRQIEIIFLGLALSLPSYGEISSASLSHLIAPLIIGSGQKDRPKSDEKEQPKEITITLPKESAYHKSTTMGCAFASEQRFFFQAGSKAIIEWDLNQNRQVREYPHTDPYVLEVSANGRTLIAGGTTASPRTFDLKKNEEVKQIAKGFPGFFPAVGAYFKVSADGETVFGPHNLGLAAYRKDGSLDRTIDVKMGFQDTYTVSPDGKNLAWAQESPLRVSLVNPNSGAVTQLKALDKQLKGPVVPMEFSSDGRYLALITNRILVFDLKKGETAFEFSPNVKGRDVIPVRLAFSPRRNRLAWVSDAGVELIDLPSAKGNRPRRVNNLAPGPVGNSCLRFSPSGDRLAGIVPGMSHQMRIVNVAPER